MKRISLKHSVLQGNQKIAEQNRQIFNHYSITSINFMSSPGAGKTTFLESLLLNMNAPEKIGVIEGDIATTLDAERIAACGARVVQINTHGACHLNADMISKVLHHFNLSQLDYLFIENVGNLVCPIEFDLGESLRVTILSTTEGTDKVAKYPAAFQCSDAIILNKMDLLPYLNFDLNHFYSSVKNFNPYASIFEVSACKREGIAQWTKWLQTKRREKEQKD